MEKVDPEGGEIRTVEQAAQTIGQSKQAQKKKAGINCDLSCLSQRTTPQARKHSQDPIRLCPLNVINTGLPQKVHVQTSIAGGTQETKAKEEKVDQDLRPCQEGQLCDPRRRRGLVEESRIRIRRGR